MQSQQSEHELKDLIESSRVKCNDDDGHGDHHQEKDEDEGAKYKIKTKTSGNKIDKNHFMLFDVISVDSFTLSRAK